MYESDMFGDEDDNEVGETFFKSMKYDFTSYFMLNKSEMDKITKVPKMVKININIKNIILFILKKKYIYIIEN